MPEFITEASQVFSTDTGVIHSFLSDNSTNVHAKTVASFGDEWNKFSHFSEEDIRITGNQYFDIMIDKLDKTQLALDVGCGSGRWSYYISDKVCHIEAIDPSTAIFSAQKTFGHIPNIRFSQADVENIPFPDNSFDIVFSLGVFHHLPDTQGAINKAVSKLKPDGHFLLYLYYSLDNRSFAYKLLFKISNLFRKLISSFPKGIKHFVCDLIAVFIYFPLVFLSRIIKTISPQKTGYRKIPLSYYNDKSFKIMRNDALDRFGTPLEKRFSKIEITEMMQNSGLKNITFSDNPPYWHVVGQKANEE